MKRIALTLMAILLLAFPLYSQNIVIPDTAFLHALIDEGVDTNGDSLISYGEAEAILSLDVSERGITDMTGLQSFINLESLSCNENLLTSLEVSSNAALTYLDISAYCDWWECFGGTITTLDISKNTALEVLYCGGQALTSLDLSNNNSLSYIEIRNIPSLNRVCVWVKPFPPRGVNVEILGSPNVYFTTECGVNFVTTPDTAFLHALIDEGVDTNGDGQISYAEAEAISKLNVGDRDIFDMTGIEAFIHLDTLDCSANQLTTLNISTNTTLACLDLSQMPTLFEVCVWAVPFLSDSIYLEISASPNLYFTACEFYDDFFEENDYQDDAAMIPDDTLHENLFVSSKDDDWFELDISEKSDISLLTVSCNFDHSMGDINIDLFDKNGILLASSKNETNHESVSCLVDTRYPYYLNVYLNSRLSNSYSLYYTCKNYLPDAVLGICNSDKNCSQFIINPVLMDTSYFLDTMHIDLQSGEVFNEILNIRNAGPDPYLFYSALDCTGLNDSLNQAISFDGVDGHIRIAGDYSLDLTGTMTLEAWICNGTGSTGKSWIISKGFDGFGYELFIDGNDQERRLGFSISPGSIHSSQILNDQKWYHVAATYDRKTIRLFINGILDTMINAAGPVSAVNRDLNFGTNSLQTYPREYFQGAIDEVRIWKRARTAREIHSFMHRELGGQEQGLVGYWPMNKGEMRVVIDHASGNSGEMTGGSTRISTSLPLVNLVKWSPDFGLIQRGTSMDYILKFNAENLKGGAYFSSIHLISHDPTSADIIIPTLLHVTDAPSFSVQPDSVKFDEIDIYKTHTRALEVVNHGSQTLRIDSVTTDLIGSKIMPASAAIDPGDKMTFHVDVFMMAKDHFDGNIHFYTNDPSDPEGIVSITGEGNKIESFALLGSIVDTLTIGYSNMYGNNFPNQSPSHDLVLEPSVVTYSIPGESNNKIPQPDTVVRTWVTTSLPDVYKLSPLEEIFFVITLDASGLESGEYYADIILEWRNPFYRKGFFPVRLHVRNKVGTDETYRNISPLQIYPNPTRGPVSIQTNREGSHDLVITSMNGQMIHKSDFMGGLYQLDLSSFPKGVYFITVRSKEFVATRKIIKL